MNPHARFRPRPGRKIYPHLTLHRWIPLVVMAACAGSGGCSFIKTAMLMTSPQTEKVDAEFNRLEGHKALVYVWAPPEVLWDYPKVQLDLAAYVTAYLEKNVKKVTMIPAVRVESYLEKSGSLQVDPVELGKHFEVDMVVHVSVFQFSMRDPGYAQFYRGRIGASVVAWDLSKPGEPADRVPLRDVMVVVPPDSNLGYINTRPEQIRQATYETFAVEVGKKFHEWERPQG